MEFNQRLKKWTEQVNSDGEAQRRGAQVFQIVVAIREKCKSAAALVKA
jgi:hypothetical protein